MKKFSLLLMGLLSLGIFSSCDDCDSNNCKNDGVCISGECECLSGFEGEFCEIITRDKLVGNYTVSSNCDDSNTPTEEWAIAASSSARDEILINNFHKSAFNVIATVISPELLDISEQTISEQGIEYTFSGNASFDDNGNITADYKVVTDSLSVAVNCNIQAIPN